MYVYYWRTYDKAMDVPVEGGCRESNPGNMATAASPKSGCVWSVAETPVARAHSARIAAALEGIVGERLDHQHLIKTHKYAVTGADEQGPPQQQQVGQYPCG